MSHMKSLKKKENLLIVSKKLSLGIGYLAYFKKQEGNILDTMEARESTR